jgi:crotonobetainyl-CoA:carnitine CoA-transferase CaiB-like acyl-CoA transferase
MRSSMSSRKHDHHPPLLGRRQDRRLCERDRIKPLIAGYLARLNLEAATALCMKAKIPFAPVARPEDLFDDPHLLATRGLLDTTFPNGTVGWLPRLPLRLHGTGFDLCSDPPRLGNATREVLSEAGIPADVIDKLIDSGVLALDEKDKSA